MVGWANIVGRDGAFTVTDSKGARLWSGVLPPSPVVLVREGHRFVYCDDHRSESGIDGTIRFQFSAEIGSATIEDRNHKRLGERPIEIVKVMIAPSPTVDDGAFQTRLANTWSVQFTPAIGRMNAPGTAFIIYQDRKENVIRRSKVYSYGPGHRSGALG